MAEEFNPFIKSYLYDTHKDRWQMETDFSEMTLDVLSAGTYLPMFSSEEQAGDYDYRKSMSAPFDLCRDGIRVRRDALWRSAPRREIDPTSKYRDILETLINDADDSGTPLNEFMQRAYWGSCVTGVDIVTQMTRLPDGAELQSLADQRSYNVRPYFMMFSPLERYDWAVNGSGGLLWSRYFLGEQAAVDETVGSSGVSEFLTLTTDQWRLWQAFDEEDDGGNKKLKVVLAGEGGHTLGKPPIVKLYYEESQKAGCGGVPLSLLTRPAVVAKVMLNLKSQADAELLAAVPRWFITGITDELPSSYGAGVLIKIQNPDAKIMVVQGDVGHIAEKRAWIMLYIEEILRLLKFWGGIGEIKSSTGSGVKLALARTDLDNELRSKAADLEAAELEMMRQAVVLATGDDIKPHEAAEKLGYAVQYEKDFVLEPVGEMLGNIQKFVTGCEWIVDEVPEVTKEMLRQLVGSLMREGSAQSIQALDEIDNASFDLAVNGG